LALSSFPHKEERITRQHFVSVFSEYLYNVHFSQQPDEEEEKNDHEDFPDDSYLMVSQLHWEDEVVWNGDDIKHKVTSNINEYMK
jgi:hypothetical protein